MHHSPTHSAGQDIHGLRTLIRRHLQDREAIKAGRVRLIYFVDAHELKAYIHGVSKDYIEGFELGPEKALRASRDRPDMLQELRLKCELAIRWVLFKQPRPVIVLPSHGVEIEEEIAYQRQRDLERDLGLLAEAQVQLRKLRDGQFAHELILQMATQALRGDINSKVQLTSYLGRAAPALGVVLNILPTGVDSIRSRIQMLVRESRLSTLGSARWSDYSLSESEVAAVRSVGLDEVLVRQWQRRLEARRGNSERSNRLDAEAIAYVEKLNATLADTGIDARGVLVTHTGTLIHASRETKHEPDTLLGVNDPIRHIRLLAWDLPDTTHTNGEPTAFGDAQGKPEDPLGDAVERLEQTLEVYNSQIYLRTGEASALPVSEANALMDAWAAFETARSTLCLASDGGALVPLLRGDDVLGATEIERLLEWLRTERELESLIADRLSRLVVTFGREVLTSEGTEPLCVSVRSARSQTGGDVQIAPIAARLVGPVELPAKGIDADLGPHRVLFPGEGIELSDGSPHSYLALSLLHGAKDSLALAEVYAKAAADSADFLRQNQLAAEARLLSAQMLRMTSARAKSGDSRSPDDIRFRLDSAQRLLTEASGLKASPRMELERAAVDLERLLHNLDSDEATRRRFAQGLDTIERAHLRVGDDLIVRMRTAELALAYAVADRAVSRDYGTKGVLTPQFVEHWHRVLISTIDQLRTNEDYLLEELPLVTRALEVIGYSIIHDESVRAGERPAVSGDCGVPNNLSLDIHSVQRGLNAYDDRVSQQLARILADINARSGSSWTYSFVHAPVWERTDIERATEAIEDPVVRDNIRAANRLLHRVGDDQRILLNEPGQVAILQEAKRRYKEVFERLTDMTSTQVRFLVQMEYCYACLLECAHTSNKEEKEKKLRELAMRYEGLRDEFGPWPTLLYRQSIVFGELGMHEEALDAIQQALNPSVDADRFVAGASWMRSTIRRRIGLHFSREAKDQLVQLKLGSPSEHSYERYRATVHKAFRSTFEGFDREPADPSLRGKTEMLRRLNNIVFYASLFLQADGSIEALHDEFTDDRFRSYLERLKAEAPAVEREWFYAHTIGAAHHVLGETALADAAADALLSLLAASGASTQSEAIRIAIEDAFSWKRAAASGARR